MNAATPRPTPTKPRFFTQKDFDRIPHLTRVPDELRLGMKTVAAVLPFRVNQYVLDELIDWSRVPEDPIFQLVFPQEGMLDPADFRLMRDMVAAGRSRDELEPHVRRIQHGMNPHPAGQTSLNVPRIDGEPLPGMQHKYRETVLFFPTQGQTCHSYCTYCFRWAQFVGLDDLKFQNKEPELLRRYVEAHPEISSVLFTGGDPMVMKARVLRRYIEPLLSIEHLASIRIGTKSVAYWPQRFVSDEDADEVLALFEEVQAAGKTLALMAHYSHPRELSTTVAERAVERIVGTGAVVRCQAPLIQHVNDDADAWADLWRKEVRLGAVPYYMFVERDTGARNYFEVPLARALDIFNDAYRQVSGLARTVRGPSMSCTPGKVLVDGVTEVAGRRVFVLKMVQARDPSWVNRVFFADYDPNACWLDHLRPAFGDAEFFFEPGLRMLDARLRRSLPVAPSSPTRLDDVEAAE
jgi:KamA family protein